jgi:hypothetical protein
MWIEINPKENINQLPPKHKRVLAWAPGGDWDDGQAGIWAVAEIDGAGVWSCLFEPTHWQPLGAAPPEMLNRYASAPALQGLLEELESGELKPPSPAVCVKQ